MSARRSSLSRSLGAVLAGSLVGGWVGLWAPLPWSNRLWSDADRAYRSATRPAADALRPEREVTGAPSVAPEPPVPPPELVIPELAYPGLVSPLLSKRNEGLMHEMADALGLDQDQQVRVREIFQGSKRIGQGNPNVTEHPISRAECRAARAKSAPLPAGDLRCGAPNMVSIYDPTRGETAAEARVCIDQYEFPNIPCEYPIVWVRASEAVELCRAVGKRICDAHEWEGACAGALRRPEEEYAFGQRRMMMEYLHNKEREIVWAYGSKADQSRCATMSKKSARCDIVDWASCGSNTYPAGAFPRCRSAFGVFDQHGNVAEHMNLPLEPDELASRHGLGETEMKGAWFIFSSYEAHPDDCRWRAPMWHVTRIDDANSHSNYHLGFRCCRDLPKDDGAAAGSGPR
jgi:sulfatase modifying factor 1